MLKRHLSSAQIIIFGFAGAILIGTALLMLPISSASGVMTSFSDSIFTATSAVCVTGLVVQDTAAYWSMFGQLVILILIQIGGLGVVTIAVATALVSGRKIGLMQRNTLKEAISAQKVGGIVRLTGFILKASFLIELMEQFRLLLSFVKILAQKACGSDYSIQYLHFATRGLTLWEQYRPFHR